MRRGHIPPKPGQGRQSAFPGKAHTPGRSGHTVVGGRTPTMRSGGSGGSGASPFGHVNPFASTSTFVKANTGFGGKTKTRALPSLNTGKKSADSGNYQHA